MAKKAIKDLANYDLIRKMHQKQIKIVNDEFIEVSLTVDALLAFQSGLVGSKPSSEYMVPQMKSGHRRVRRRISDVLNTLDRRIGYKEYSHSIVFLVANIESYISGILKICLISYPKKIKISAKGNEASRHISLESILDSSDLDEVIESEVNRRVQDVLYCAPTQYLSYFKGVTGFDLGNHADEYIEIKATRDILIHSSGVANDLYVSKSNGKARAASGEVLNIDKEYFESSVRCLKNVTSSIYRGMIEKYGESERVGVVLSKIQRVE